MRMTYDQWMKDTAVFARQRSNELQAVDRAFRTYQLRQDIFTRNALASAFSAWKVAQQRKGQDWHTSLRNQKKAVEILDADLKVAAPRQNPKIFDSTNDNYLHNFNQAGAGRGTYAGMCTSLSALWLDNILSGKRDVISKPDEGRAQYLQAKFRWDRSLGWQDRVNLLKSANLKGVSILTNATVPDAEAQMASRGGGFLIDNGSHAVAVYIKPDNFYFYDCEKGLFLFQTESEWKSQISSMGYDNDQWTVWSVTN